MYNLSNPIKTKTSKKGSLNLSINAIVVLILAITMLSLGLGFMKNLFKKTTGQLADVGEEIKNQMVEQLRSSSAKLTLNVEDTTIARSESKDYYFGVKNVEPGAKTFKIEKDCGSGMGGLKQGLSEETLDTIEDTGELEQNEVSVQKMVIAIDPGADTGTARCTLKIKKEDGSTYAKKSFFVTVE